MLSIHTKRIIAITLLVGTSNLLNAAQEESLEALSLLQPFKDAQNNYFNAVDTGRLVGVRIRILTDEQNRIIHTIQNFIAKNSLPDAKISINGQLLPLKDFTYKLTFELNQITDELINKVETFQNRLNKYKAILDEARNAIKSNLIDDSIIELLENIRTELFIEITGGSFAKLLKKAPITQQKDNQMISKASTPPTPTVSSKNINPTQIANNFKYIFNNMQDPKTDAFISESAAKAVNESINGLIQISSTIPVKNHAISLALLFPKIKNSADVIDKNLIIVSGSNSSWKKFKNIFKKEDEKDTVVSSQAKTDAAVLIAVEVAKLTKYLELEISAPHSTTPDGVALKALADGLEKLINKIIADPDVKSAIKRVGLRPEKFVF